MSQPILSLTPTDEAEIDAMWSKQPRRPPLLTALAPLPPGTVTVTITCRVCGLREAIPLHQDGKICRSCAADLDATRRHAEAQLAAVMVQGNALEERWTAAIDALAPELRERWLAAYDQRAQAEIRLARLANARLYSTTPPAQAEKIAAARAELEAIKAKFERAGANPTNPLQRMVLAERAYINERTRLRGEIQRWQIALQEIEAAGGLPF